MGNIGALGALGADEEGPADELADGSEVAAALGFSGEFEGVS